MEMSAEPHFIDKLISYFGKKLFVIIMPFEALGGVQVGDIAVCWSILISLSVKASKNRGFRKTDTNPKGFSK